MLGFPCNQFAEQEPGTEADIAEFVSTNYDIDFPMFSKIEVNGEGAAPLYAWLKEQAPGDAPDGEIAWNFTKFLVGADGEVKARFEPTTTPEEIAAQLPDLL